MERELRKAGDRVLVTGGTGFIGRHLVSALVARDRRVRVLDRRPPVCATPGVEYVSGSVLDPGLVDETLRDADEVYHLAGLPGMWLPNKNDFHAVNFKGTEIVIAAARKRGVARFLHCSTESILFRPASSRNDGSEPSLLPPEQMPGVYTRSKMLAEQSAEPARNIPTGPEVTMQPHSPAHPSHGAWHQPGRSSSA